MASLTDRLENSLVVPSCRRRWIDEDCGGSGGAENHVFPGGYSRAANHFESRVFCRRAVRKSRRDPLSLPPFSDLRPSDSWLDHEGRARVSPVECRRNEVFHPFVPLPPSPSRASARLDGERNPVRAHTGTDFSSFVWFVSREVIPSSGDRQGRTFKLGRESRGIHERNAAAGIPRGFDTPSGLLVVEVPLALMRWE